jgi:hypothetical protein
MSTTPKRGPRPREDHQPEAAITKSALGDTAITATGETAATVLATRETAQVQARIMQALARPRDFAEVRERFAADCRRMRFALVARYAKPQGWVTDPVTGKPLYVNGERVRAFVRGWSIRAVESALQALGSIDVSATTIFADELREIVACRVWDLERNLLHEAQVTVEKTTERRALREGERALASRPNSYGDTVYLLPASEDDVRLKRNRLVSMSLRTLGLRVIPGDLLDEFLEPVEELRAKAIEAEKTGVLADPRAALKRVLDQFLALGVRAADLAEYLGGRSVETATPDQILELRIVGADVRAGSYSWHDALAGSPYREAKTEDEAPVDERAAAARAKIQARLEEQHAKRAQAQAQAPAPAAPLPPEPAAPPSSPTGEREPGEDG